MQQPAAKRRFNNFLFSILLILGLLLVAELTAAGALSFLKKWKGIEYSPLPEARLSDSQREIIRRMLAGEEGHIRYHPRMGWVPNPATTKTGFRCNTQGFRAAAAVVDAQPAADRLRVATFGDSFTFGHGVTYPDTWQALLERQRPEWEVLNFGVSGYAQDQAYWRYRYEGRDYHPRIVIFGFNSENVFRNLNVFRPFYSPQTEFPLTKPRFLELDGQLTELPNPFQQLEDYRLLLNKPAATIRRLGEHDFYYHQLYRSGGWDHLAMVRYLKLVGYQLSGAQHPDMLFLKDNIFNVDSEGYRLATAVIDRFVDAVREEGAIPVILILPTGKDLARKAAGEPKQYLRFAQHWEKQQYHVLDLNDLIYNDRINVRDPAYYTEDGHNSGRMHALMAGHIARYLSEDVLPRYE
ncbi:MAG: SGNH/GDSL hydrolase family protein [Candidatus Omnitrophica bacterium]|nr:SGNH/GDSL hydrolase family protein [Candidatus Omnitrophota bacterium]MCB9720503.1 SGNH/GDSL hydrolase family protein [Candidatus Omnitrophota bacterium]